MRNLKCYSISILERSKQPLDATFSAIRLFFGPYLLTIIICLVLIIKSRDVNCKEVKSINYPSNYGNNHRSRFTISAPNSYYVNLTVIDFDIPSANNATELGTCIFDYLTLIDGYTGKRLGCYCNENLPPPFIISPWNELIIQFDTNSETTGRGFYFEYEFMKLELGDEIKRQLKITEQNYNNNSTTGSLFVAPSSSQSSTGNSNLKGSNVFCPGDWQYFRSSCYKAFNEPEPLQWYDAENRCINHGKGLDGHLVSILDKSEALVIHYLMTNVWRSARYRDYYIGLIDVSREGVYRWSDNNPMSYTDWELKPMLLEEETPAQPDGGAYEDCTIIRYNSFSRTTNWHDVPCSLGKHYHSHLDKINQFNFKWDYVNSYICKSDSISAGRSKVRRPLFSNEFVPYLIQSGHLIAHLTSGNASKNKPLRPAAVNNLLLMQSQSQAGASVSTMTPSLGNSNSSSSSSVSSIVVSNNDASSNSSTNSSRFYLSMLDDNRYFVCDNLEVISVVLRCDGVAHCRDGSDESVGCDQDCLEWQYKCQNGRCISIGFYCNFVDDCGDGSDESRCERHRCKLNEFRCQNGQCISEKQRCDLLPDCSDSSDEGKLCTVGSNCQSSSTFQCYSGICIPQYAVCDFQIDCPGKFHEDEDAVTCDVILKSRSLDYKIFQQPGSSMLNQSPTSSFISNWQSLASKAQIGDSNSNSNGNGNNSTSLVLASTSAPMTTQLRSNPNNLNLNLNLNNLFKCNSGNMIDKSLRCLYEIDRYGFQIGCRDVSHLTDCADFECPQRDYVKCANSYCVPWRYICDGKWDCTMGDDEVGCARYLCPGQYKCANQSSCILLHQLCDGHRQCPMGDDEWFCDLQCPSQCDCIGQSVNCRGASLTQLPGNYIARSVRKLDLSHNKLGPNLSLSDFSNYHDLGELILHHNGIEVLIPRKFHQLRNLYKLDLSNNQIHSVKRGAFAGLRRVTQLLLESNPELVILEPEAFLGLSSLQMLNISSSRILALRKNTFDGLTSLRHLLLRSNMIVEIEDGAFRSLTSLVSLDMSGNEIRYFTKSVFSDLKSLRNLSTDSFKFCCLVNHQIPADRCLPLADEISDCEDLLSGVAQSTCIIVAGLIAFGGNFVVILWYRNHEEEREQGQVNSTLLLSLGCADLLMGIYLIIIAAVDIWFRGRYIENSDNWRESSLCQLCGFLSTVSIEVSIFTLVFIAYNRFTEIRFTLSDYPYKLTPDWTWRLILFSWSLALTIATLPLVIKPYFKGQFYSRSGVCLAFHITNQKAAGWLYSSIVFQGFYLVALVIIGSCYYLMYKDLRRAINPNLRKFTLIIATNFAAWSPTIILRLVSLAGYSLPTAVYSWIAVLVLPINSAINPLIYTIPSIRKFFREMVQNHRLRKSGSLIVAASVPMRNNGHHQQQPSQVQQQQLAFNSATGNQFLHHHPKEMIPLLVTGGSGDLRQRLAQRNVPPGYEPLRQFIQQTKDLTAGHLLQIALEIARDLEAKHKEAKAYVTLDESIVYVMSSGENSNDGKRRKFNVFLADHHGYKPRRLSCSHLRPPVSGSNSSGQPMDSIKGSHHNNRQYSQKKQTNCECYDVERFGDIIFKLVGFYNVRKRYSARTTPITQLSTATAANHQCDSKLNKLNKDETD